MSQARAAGVGVAPQLAILLCAALLGVQVIRNAIVAQLADTLPLTAAKLWSGHPAVEIQLGMVEIASATRQRQPIPPGAFAAAADAAVKAPLAPEPYLIRGVQAQMGGRDALARASFIAAVRRDPRSLPAHYFLAEQDLRSGNVAHGLGEIAALAQLAPDGVVKVAPFVAMFARERRNWPAVRALFRRNSSLAAYALLAMAADPANAGPILALSDPAKRGPDSLWLAPLVHNLVEAGDYRTARATWAIVAGVKAAPGELLYDAGFDRPAAPPPFNWTLTSSSVGLAERQPGGRLHAIYYGQQDGPLARQLLLLAPGSYRLSLRAAGDASQTAKLMWSLTCAKATEAVSRINLAAAAQRTWTFTVPAGCPAQWLELVGVSSDISRQSEVTVSDLRLVRVGNGS